MLTQSVTANDLHGSWEVLVEDSRLASIPAIVTCFNTVILLERLYFNITQKDFNYPQYPECPQPEEDATCFVPYAIYDLISMHTQALTILQMLTVGTLLAMGGDRGDQENTNIKFA